MKRALLSLALAATGCDNAYTLFPPGYEPFAEHIAPLPEATETDPCPEEMVFVRAEDDGRAVVVHGTACIHQPLATVWDSAQMATWSHDPQVETFMELRPPVDDICIEAEGDYETYVFVMDIVGIEFRVCWRHTVVEGTDEAPLLTASRWQKVWGSTLLTRSEGSMVMEPLEGHDDVTVVRMQYRLQAPASGEDTVRTFMAVLYGRLRDHANGVPLDPP